MTIAISGVDTNARVSDSTPSTQAHGDSAAVGTGTAAARDDHKHAMPAAGGGDFILQGSDTTEATTTSTTTVDLQTVASLTIAVAEAMQIDCSYRKTTGHASVSRFTLKLNATIVGTGSGWSSAGNAAESTTIQFIIPPRVALHLYGSAVIHGATNKDGAMYGLSTATTPEVEITDVVVGGYVDNASNTLGVDDVHVYVKATN